MGDLAIALPKRTRLVYVDTATQALDKAGESALLLVDERLPGALELCRRLRADPVTAAIPLVLRSQRAIQVPPAVADASVLADDVGGLVQVIEQMIPEDVPEPDMWDVPEDHLFDDAEATVIWRRPEEEEAAHGWPPPPPIYNEEEDRVEFAVNFSGYMNSLIEALEDPSKLSSDERKRLRQVSYATVDTADKCLDQVQTWVNKALMAKDLTQMRVLTSAKNSLYEKLQKMRGLVAQMRQEQSADNLTPLEQASNLGGLPRKRAAGKKSQITLAAEAKEAAERATQTVKGKARGRVKGEPQHPVAGVARKVEKKGTTTTGTTTTGTTWLWIIIAVVAVGGSAAWVAVSLLRREPGSLQVAGQNTRPKMQRISLEQTPGGIYARPEAMDDERDRISFTFRWFVNGQLVDRARAARLASNSYQVGDSVEVVVQPRDGYGAGSPMRSRPHSVASLAQRRPVPPPPAP